MVTIKIEIVLKNKNSSSAKKKKEPGMSHIWESPISRQVCTKDPVNPWATAHAPMNSNGESKINTSEQSDEGL